LSCPDSFAGYLPIRQSRECAPQIAQASRRNHKSITPPVPDWLAVTHGPIHRLRPACPAIAAETVSGSAKTRQLEALLQIFTVLNLPVSVTNVVRLASGFRVRYLNYRMTSPGISDPCSHAVQAISKGSHDAGQSTVMANIPCKATGITMSA